MEREQKEFEPRITVGLVLHCGLDSLAEIKEALDKIDVDVIYQRTVGGDKRLIIEDQEVKKNEKK